MKCLSNPVVNNWIRYQLELLKHCNFSEQQTKRSDLLSAPCLLSLVLYPETKTISLSIFLMCIGTCEVTSIYNRSISWILDWANMLRCTSSCSKGLFVCAFWQLLSVKSQKLKQTANFSCSFWKARSPVKLSLYGKLENSVLWAFPSFLGSKS